jgi:uncharacterized protein YkwD
MPTKQRHHATKPLPAAALVLLLTLAPLLARACPPIDRDAVVAQTNAARERGAACAAGPAAPLRWQPALEQAALAHAQWLATQNTLLHSGPQGQALPERARAAGYRFARITENLGYGQGTLALVLQAWTDSPTHCANLHDPRVTEMALACVPSAAGRPVWVMLQGAPAR